jgi:hypothetical protein
MNGRYRIEPQMYSDKESDRINGINRIGRARRRPGR